MRSTWMALSFVAIATSTAACSATVRDGVFACNDDTECPTGYRCGAGRCRAHGGSQCRQDAQCDDQNNCTEDVCEGGYCGHTPDTTQEDMPCYDGLFCNGADVCHAGVCTNMGPVPCTTCNESTGCSSCGEPGLPCCEGQVCNTGSCDGTSCIACGAEGQPCCNFISCNPGLACDGSTGQPLCTACGGEGQPCCDLVLDAGGACGGAPNLVCDYSSAPQRCRKCGNMDEPCCDDGCHDGSFCQAANTGGPPSCVAVSCAGGCAPGTVCGTDPTGTAGCVPCGLEGEPCCAGGDCSASQGTCFQGKCSGFVMPL